MDIGKIIQVLLELDAQQTPVTVNQILEKLDNHYSRAYILRFLQNMISENQLRKIGSTKSAQYLLASNPLNFIPEITKKYANINLEEDHIVEELKGKLSWYKTLPENVQKILDYALTEMINNAIDHSHAKEIEVSVGRIQHKEKTDIRFKIADSPTGIGAYKSIMQCKKLHSSHEALQDLLKGKTTSLPEKHSGEGIFFTSKIADIFILESELISLRIDNQAHDTFVAERPYFLQGTEVFFSIRADSNKKLGDIFKAFYTDPEELAFDKTIITVKLYEVGGTYVSRSEAKRLLSGLEKFKTIVIDFDKVNGIGQAFADEIFRVYKNTRPEVRIEPIHMNDAVQFMVERVTKD